MRIIYEHIDLLGVICGLSGAFLLAKKRFIALLIIIISNLIWVIWGLHSTSWSLSFLQACFFILNSRTIIEWIKLEIKKPIEEQEDSFKTLNKFLNIMR
jgi:uncharacterized ion transporter superfamily protein YfcC